MCALPICALQQGKPTTYYKANPTTGKNEMWQYNPVTDTRTLIDPDVTTQGAISADITQGGVNSRNRINAMIRLSAMHDSGALSTEDYNRLLSELDAADREGRIAPDGSVTQAPYGNKGPNYGGTDPLGGITLDDLNRLTPRK